MCRCAAARPRAVRAASFARRVVSKPGQAPPPPTGTAAWPSSPSGALHTGGACDSGVPGQAPPPPTGTAADPSCAPHQWGLVCWRVVRCVVSTPGRVPRLDVFPILSFACNSPATLSNREFTTLELQRFQTLLKLHPIELHAKFGGGGVVAAQGSQPGPAARGCRSQAMSARWAGCLKPLSPLLACIRVEVKPPSPLRVRKGCFWRIFPAQR